MRLRTPKQIQALNEALDRCKASVWIESPCGERIELSDPVGRCIGIERLKHSDADNMEFFALEYGDFVALSRCLNRA